VLLFHGAVEFVVSSRLVAAAVLNFFDLDLVLRSIEL
jgi:hypothetical protein